MSAIQTLIDEGVCVLWHDYRSGHADDLSGHGNDGVPSGVVLNREGARFGSAGKIVVANSAELEAITSGCIICGGEYLYQPPSGTYWRLLEKQDVGNIHFSLVFNQNLGLLMLGSSGPSQAMNYTFSGEKCLAVNFGNGLNAELFADGVLAVTSGAPNTITSDDAPVTIGANYSGGHENQFPISCCLFFSRVLTPTEHAAVYAELDSMTWPQKQSRGEAHYMGRQLLVDGDMADPGVSAWIAYLNANLSKVAGALRIARDGTNNPYALQGALSIGKRYRVIGTVSSDGVATPKVYCGQSAGTWMGVNTTTAPQAFDVVVTADTSSFLIQTVTTVGTAYCDFHPLEVRELISDRRTEWDDRRDGTLLWGTDWGTPVVANVPPNAKAGPFTQVSGASAIVTREVAGRIVKAVQRTNDGGIAISAGEMRQIPSDAAFGTWEWGINRPASGVIYLAPISGGTDATAGGAYSIRLLADGSITLYENGVGALISGAVGTISDGVDYLIRLTRSAAGLFKLYVDGVLIGEATDLTIVESAFMAITMSGAACEVDLGALDASRSVLKIQGVIPP